MDKKKEQTASTAREKAAKLIAENPRFTEATPSGKGFVIPTSKKRRAF